ncbi:hypothetical protein GPJ56_004860 [Histomonas meleagridis]|uniref:uncharacterized protein n=1 Tax=Histomonas meleagridis TaxID=135588 RepID=UPI003559C0CB|nr:hypothetical protein GPJ56_004860 [Histomonas meleagridis]KAH0803510.1 hypothetical protein GO595_003854 [Histomonas meleagridis]
MSERLTEWLVDHPNYMGYIKIVGVKTDNNTEVPAGYQERYHQNVINLLYSHLTEQTTLMGPSHQKSKAKPTYLSGRGAIAFRKSQFIKLELKRIQQDQFSKYSQCIADFINLLSTPHILSEDLVISIDHQKLFSETFEKSKYEIALKIKRIQLKNEAIKQTEEYSTFENQKFLFKNIIEATSSIFDKESAFLIANPLQDKFDVLFDFYGFPFSSVLNEAIDSYTPKSSNAFVRQLVQIVRQLLDYFGYRQEGNDNLLVMLMFRCAFDKLYAVGKSPLNREPFNVERLTTIDPLSKFLMNCTFADLCPPDEYCPKHEKDSKVSEVFGNDPLYHKCVRSLESLVFFTNPIDALNEVHMTVTNIEKAANSYHQGTDSLLAFEVIFGLFLCVTAAAHIPELQLYTDFINECTPQSGLTAVFDYAHTKLQAATNYLRTLIENLQKNPQANVN